MPFNLSFSSSSIQDWEQMLNEIILNPYIWDILNLIFLVLGCLKLSVLAIINTLGSAGLYLALFCFIVGN